MILTLIYTAEQDTIKIPFKENFIYQTETIVLESIKPSLCGRETFGESPGLHELLSFLNLAFIWNIRQKHNCFLYGHFIIAGLTFLNYIFAQASFVNELHWLDVDIIFQDLSDPICPFLVMSPSIMYSRTTG